MKLENFLAADKEKHVLVHSSGHTDGGSVSLRYCEDRMSEYLDVETGAWVYIEPRRDCLIVNVGDLLHAASRGQFQGPLHRVGQPMIGVGDRQCVTYHLWPADSAGWRRR